MTPTPPSTTSSSAGAHSPEGQYRVVRKRNRVPLSCAPCRHRKLKCNRSSPCENCVKRGDATSCTYATPSGRKKSQQSQSDVKTPDDMQNRIDRLEGLVLSLMTNGAQSAGPAAAAAIISSGTSHDSGQTNQDSQESPMVDEEDEEDDEEESETEKVTKSFGVMKVDNKDNKTYYIGESHWAAILNDIAEVRSFWKTHKREYDDQVVKVALTNQQDPHDSGPALLFSSAQPPPRNEIISALPSRYLTDILVARYFNTFDPATHILHGPTFHKQYVSHWEHPTETSIVWVGMLFAMMRLSMLSYHAQGDEPPEFRGKALDLSVFYRTQMTNCLILADYTKPHAHLIETLIFHLHGEYTRNREAESSVWVLTGMIARMAMRMGYHRDSRSFPDLSPFQGEMRRRVWTYVRQADVMFSFQVSMPSMIRTGDSDTDLPRNIYDDEFDENCQELPPSRPITEPTPISHTIAKAKLALGFSRVTEHINSVNASSYEEVMKLDRGVREIYDSLPDHLRVRSMQDQALDPVMLIISRYNLAELYHKSMIVLHRRFLQLARTNPRYVHSRRACLESAMALLEHQAILHQETRTKGRMQTMQWYNQSMMANDFCLAATIICMDLYYGLQLPSSAPQGAVFSWGIPSKETMISALDTCCEIWAELRDQSMMAFKLSELISMIMVKIKSAQPSAPENRSMTHNSFALDTADEKQNAAMTLGLLSSGGMTPNPSITSPLQQDPQSQQQSRNPADSLFPPENGPLNAGSPFSMNLFGNPMDLTGAGGGGMNLDWEAWDSYMSNMNQQPMGSNLANFDPANNLWGNGSTSSAATPANPFSPSAAYNTSSNLNTFGSAMNPASPGSLNAILNPGLFYATSTNSSGAGALDTPESSATGSGTSPQAPSTGPGAASGKGSSPGDQEKPNPNGPFMGNPESNVMGSSNRNAAWTNWSTR